MLERRYNKLLLKGDLSPKEIQELINYVYLLREQRTEMVLKLQNAIDKIVKLEKRVEFLRSITQIKEV